MLTKLPTGSNICNRKLPTGSKRVLRKEEWVLGICWNAVHYKLTGEKPFTLQEAITLADWMDCSLDWLTGRKPE